MYSMSRLLLIISFTKENRIIERTFLYMSKQSQSHACLSSINDILNLRSEKSSLSRILIEVDIRELAVNIT